MKEYGHGGDIYKYDNKEMIDFSSNVNPKGLPLSVKNAIIDNIDEYSKYPDPNCRELKIALEEYHNIPKSYVVCGNGAADIIFRVVLAKKPKKALIVVPTFSEYEIALNVVDCEIKYHVLLEKDNYMLTSTILEKLEEDIHMIFICNPNNPTGHVIEKNLMIKIAEEAKKKNILLVVDECFNDFLVEGEKYTLIPYLKENLQVVILKAFTKNYAMAGLRVGYCLSSNLEFNKIIENTLQPWSVSTVGMKAGVAALKEKEYLEESKKQNDESRKYLVSNLKDMGFKLFDSKANYIFFYSNIENLDEKTKEYSILIRDCSNYIGLEKGYYRIAVKNQEDNVTLIKVLREIIQRIR